HPAVKALPDEWRTPGDELYQTIKLGPRSTALLQGKAEKFKSDHIVCWVSTYGKGKVFATTLGHDLKTVNMPEYHRLLANGILWACDKLGEDGKAKEGYGGGKETGCGVHIFPPPSPLLGEGGGGGVRTHVDQRGPSPHPRPLSPLAGRGELASLHRHQLLRLHRAVVALLGDLPDPLRELLVLAQDPAERYLVQDKQIAHRLGP